MQSQEGRNPWNALPSCSALKSACVALRFVMCKARHRRAKDPSLQAHPLCAGPVVRGVILNSFDVTYAGQVLTCQRQQLLSIRPLLTAQQRLHLLEHACRLRATASPSSPFANSICTK